MEFKVKTTMKWSEAEANQPQDLIDARSAYLEEAVKNQKTDSVHTPPISEDRKTSERYWATDADAEDWKAFVTDLAAKHGLVVEVTIS